MAERACLDSPCWPYRFFTLAQGAACYAIELQAHANVNVVPALSLNQTSSVDFGILDESGSCEMQEGGLLTGSNAACHGSGQTGTLVIKGENERAVNISLMPGTSEGIVFVPKTRSEQQKVVLHDGQTTVEIFGELQLNEPSAGEHHISFQITANYE